MQNLFHVHVSHYHHSFEITKSKAFEAEIPEACLGICSSPLHRRFAQLDILELLLSLLSWIQSRFPVLSGSLNYFLDGSFCKNKSWIILEEKTGGRSFIGT